jgi:UDP-N-acetyl-D-galactosamine dehydrogenase
MRIAIVGIGYVGIQLAVALGRDHETVGFDLDNEKIMSYSSGCDPTGELSSTDLDRANKLIFSTDPEHLRGCEVYIVSVPTPIDNAKNPDLAPLISASHLVGETMAPGATVVYESTVFPGATEEICIPALESSSGLIWQRDFHVGYSPERINPGDHDHTLTNITKVVSADNDVTLKMLTDLYGSVVDAGVYQAPSIRVAEAAKVIENTQRDLNIALVNELAIIFDRLDINTSDVLEAAESKWNFLPFKPGLVGGHCIGVDPYYLTHKAQLVDYHPEVILAGRRINDYMGSFIATKTVKLMSQAGLDIANTTVNIFGLTFKENCNDTRNSQVLVLIRELQVFGLEVIAVDPWADQEKLGAESNIFLTPMDEVTPAPVAVLAVPHQAFYERGFSWLDRLIQKPGLLVDVKSVFRDEALLGHQLAYWSL